MADSAVAVTAGSGTSIDTRTEGTNGNHRQVVVLGDPATNAGVAPVDATAGLKVDLGADNDVTVTSGTITTITNVVHVDDNSSTISIDDGAGSITVDGTVGVSGTVTVDSELTTADLDLGAGTDTRAVVGIVGSKSGGAQLIPGDATAGLKVDLGADNDVTVTSGTITTITNVVHVDDNSSTISIDDGAGNISIDDGGNSITVDNGGTFAVQDSQVIADNAGFTDGTSKVFPTGYIYDEVAGTALTENDVAAARINANRAQINTIEDGTTRGRYATVTAANAVKVDGSAVTQPVSIASAVPVTDNSGSLTVDNAGTFAVQATLAAGATNIAKAEDVASADADVGVPAMAVRKATPANTSGTDGDYEMLQMSAGRLWTSATIDAALPAGTNAIGKLAANSGVTIGAVEIAASQTLATLTTLTGGGVAHDGGDSGNPIKIGFKAKSTLSGVTLVAADDRTDAFADLDGAQITRPNSAIGDYVNGNASNTDGTSTQVLAAGAAGVKHYITDVTLTNTSSSNIYVELKDGTTAKWTFPVPANGGVTHHFATPIGGTAATAWNFDPSAAASTVYCSVSGFKSKI